MFKVGDKIRLVLDKSNFRGNLIDDRRIDNMTKGKVYTVLKRTYHEDQDAWVRITGDNGVRTNLLSERFEVAKLTNEERIAKRMEEIDVQHKKS